MATTNMPGKSSRNNDNQNDAANCSNECDIGSLGESLWRDEAFHDLTLQVADDSDAVSLEKKNAGKDEDQPVDNTKSNFNNNNNPPVMEQVTACRMVLAARSLFFRKLLYGGFQEGQNSSFAAHGASFAGSASAAAASTAFMPVITIGQIRSPKVLRQIVEYLHTDKVSCLLDSDAKLSPSEKKKIKHGNGTLGSTKLEDDDDDHRLLRVVEHAQNLMELHEVAIYLDLPKLAQRLKHKMLDWLEEHKEASFFFLDQSSSGTAAASSSSLPGSVVGSPLSVASSPNGSSSSLSSSRSSTSSLLSSASSHGSAPSESPPRPESPSSCLLSPISLLQEVTRKAWDNVRFNKGGILKQKQLVQRLDAAVVELILKDAKHTTSEYELFQLVQCWSKTPLTKESKGEAAEADKTKEDDTEQDRHKLAMGFCQKYIHLDLMDAAELSSVAEAGQFFTESQLSQEYRTIALEGSQAHAQGILPPPRARRRMGTRIVVEGAGSRGINGVYYNFDGRYFARAAFIKHGEPTALLSGDEPEQQQEREEPEPFFGFCKCRIEKRNVCEYRWYILATKGSEHDDDVFYYYAPATPYSKVPPTTGWRLEDEGDHPLPQIRIFHNDSFEAKWSK